MSQVIASSRGGFATSHNLEVSYPRNIYPDVFHVCIREGHGCKGVWLKVGGEKLPLEYLVSNHRLSS